MQAITEGNHQQQGQGQGQEQEQEQEQQQQQHWYTGTVIRSMLSMKSDMAASCSGLGFALRGANW